MKRLGSGRLVASLVAVGTLAVVALVIAGPLDPPAGPVTPTYKTLTDVEPRIAIKQSMIPLTITDRGSYYLAENISYGVDGGSAISIQVAGGSTRATVSIDLNGFEIRQTGTAPIVRGISVSGDDQGGSVIIRNGFISGFFRGIVQTPGYGLNVDHVDFGGNNIGIYTAGAAIISGCVFQRGLYGIYVDSAQQGQTFSGGAVVSNCTAKLVTNGFYGGAGTTFTNCEVFNYFGDGFELAGGCTVRNCAANGGTIGIIAADSNLIIDNRVIGAQQYNIRVIGTRNRIQNNTVVGNGISAPPTVVRGIAVDAANNVVSGNLVRNCYNLSVLDNYTMVPGNQVDLLIAEVPQAITWPCTVTLAGDVVGVSGQNGITVSSDNVTIDLGGHALRGVPGSVDGIAVPVARRNLAVRNGTISGWGNSGVWATNATGSQFEHVISQGNVQYGFLAGSDSILRECQAISNGITGVSTASRALISNCAASSNTQSGFSLGNESQIIDSVASANITTGILAGDGTQISRCNASNNMGVGIYLNNGVSVTNCNVRTNALDGIRVGTSCLVSGNNTNGNGTAAGTQHGIKLDGSASRIEGNNLSFEDVGIGGSGTGNFIARNTLRSAAVVIAAGNSYGPFINVNGVNDITGTAGSNHPQANFFY